MKTKFSQVLFLFVFLSSHVFAEENVTGLGAKSNQSSDAREAEDELFKMTSMINILTEAIEKHRSIAGDYEIAEILLDTTLDPLARLKSSILTGKTKDEAAKAEALAARLASIKASTQAPGGEGVPIPIVEPIKPLEDIRATLVQWSPSRENIVAVIKIGDELNMHYSIGSNVVQNSGAPNQRVYELKNVTRTESPTVKDRWSYQITLMDKATRRMTFLDIK